MNDHSIVSDKTTLRAEARARRAALSPRHREEAARAACETLAGHLVALEARVVALYWPIGDELDCRVLLETLPGHGMITCLPRVSGDARPLVFPLAWPDAPLEPSAFGTMAPEASAPLLEPDTIVVPLLAFDAWGTRLGYGGGYYDRTLGQSLRPVRAIGLGFEPQRFARLPREAHDVGLDGIVTEAGYEAFP